MCIDSQSLEELAFSSKVPQRSILGPLLFIIGQFSVLNGLRNIISCLHKQ